MDTPTIVDPPYSFFDLASEYGHNKPLKRCLSVLRRLGVRVFIREQEIVPKDRFSSYAEIDLPAIPLICEISALRVHRLHFFSAILSDSEQIPDHEESFLGTVVMHGYDCSNDEVEWILDESFIRPERSGESYICAYTEKKINVGAHCLEVAGAIQHQQNAVTNCCAHVAIRSSLANLRNSKVNIPTVKSINADVGIDHKKRMARTGLQTEEIANVIEAAGARPVVYVFDTSADNGICPENGGNSLSGGRRLNFDHILYLAIESGYPAILGFVGETGKGHVVTVLGHTFNGNSWLPEANLDYSLKLTDEGLGYIPSAFWTDNFIFHDDNFGPYYCLPSTFLKNQVKVVIAVTDLDESDVFADEAEIQALGLTAELATVKWPERLNRKWANILFEHVNEGRGIARTTVARKSDYLAELLGSRIVNRASEIFDHLMERLPNRFWISELSVPELFSANRAKIGEVIVDLSGAPLIGRFPGFFVVADGDRYLVEESDAEAWYPLRKLPRCPLQPSALVD